MEAFKRLRDEDKKLMRELDNRTDVEDPEPEGQAEMEYEMLMAQVRSLGSCNVSYSPQGFPDLTYPSICELSGFS